MRGRYTATKSRACDGKPRHTETSARTHVTRLVQGGTAEGSVRAYDCKHCDHWHVGHVAQKGR